MMTSEKFYNLFDEELGYDVNPTTSCENLLDDISKYIIPALNNRYGYTFKSGWKKCITLNSLYDYLIPYGSSRSKDNAPLKATPSSSISRDKSKSVSSILSIRATILESIDKINHSIESGNSSLSNAIKELNDIEPCVDIKNTWYGTVKIDTIRESILSAHNNLAQYIKKCGKALRTTNENLAHTLKLVQILAAFEADLYRTINKEAESNKSLKEKVEEWCSRSNIKDNNVKDLLAVSFEKVYILRDRLKDIKKELTQRIDKIQVTVESFQRFADIKDDLYAQIREEKLKSNTKFYEVRERLSQLSSEFDEVIAFQKRIEAELESIRHKHDNDYEILNESITQLQSKFGEDKINLKKVMVITVATSVIVSITSSLLTYFILQ